MKKLLFLLLPAFVFGSCSPIFYSPPAQNVPLFTQEKEFTVSASLTDAESAGGINMNAAYAVSPHMGIVVNGSGYFPDSKSDSTSYGSGGLIEAGAGYFTPVAEKFVFETYGLLNYGWMRNSFPESAERHPETDGKILANLIGIAVQPSFGFKTKYFEAALSTKTGLIKYTNIRGHLIEQNDDQSEEGSQQSYLSDRKNNFMIEPALTLRGGWDFLKIQLQAGKSFNLSHSHFPQDEGWVSIGFFYRIAK